MYPEIPTFYRISTRHLIAKNPLYRCMRKSVFAIKYTHDVTCVTLPQPKRQNELDDQALMLQLAVSTCELMIYHDFCYASWHQNNDEIVHSRRARRTIVSPGGPKGKGETQNGKAYIIKCDILLTNSYVLSTELCIPQCWYTIFN